METKVDLQKYLDRMIAALTKEPIVYNWKKSGIYKKANRVATVKDMALYLIQINNKSLDEEMFSNENQEEIFAMTEATLELLHKEGFFNKDKNQYIYAREDLSDYRVKIEDKKLSVNKLTEEEKIKMQEIRDNLPEDEADLDY